MRYVLSAGVASPDRVKRTPITANPARPVTERQGRRPGLGPGVGQGSPAGGGQR